MEAVAKTNQFDCSFEYSEIRSFFNHPEMGVFTLTLTGKFLKSNKKFCEMVGYTEKALATMFLQEVCFSEEIKKLSQREDKLGSKRKGYYSFEESCTNRSADFILCKAF